MSNLKQLINNLCPDGVEFKKLCDISIMKRGSTLTKSQAVNGSYPVISGGREPSFYCDKYNREGECITVAGSGTAGYVQYWNEPIFVNDAFSIVAKEGILTKYIYYCLSSLQNKIYETKKGAVVPHVHISSIENFKIPVPPLEVQREIVRILDLFTNLTAELTAELTARKKQYEYYRDKLLNFGDDVKRKTLGEISKISRGASPRPIRNFLTSDENGVNWIKIGDVAPAEKYITGTEEKITPAGATKSKRVKPGDFILSNSMSFGRPYILKIDGCIHDGWLSISEFENVLISDYLYYVLISSPIQDEMKKKASFGGAVRNLNADIVKNIKIPVPPIDTQIKIVNILDKFEKLCNSLIEGIPAEINARKKQYEYYRDKLLNFKNLNG